jgi:Zn-dependent membrane protease YugP
MDQVNTLYIFLAALLIPALAQGYVMLTYDKFKKKENAFRISGYDAAKEIADKNGLLDMYIVETGGTLSDHYDPNRKTVRLSHDVYHGKSIAAVAIAAHEVGHAIQDKEGYFFMKFRKLIFPVVSLGTRFAYIVLITGFILSSLDLMYLAVGLVGLGLLFQLITLPVEFDASKRAKAELSKHNLVDNKTLSGTSSVLNAAALTYVAGVLASALEMLRLILIIQSRRR